MYIGRNRLSGRELYSQAIKANVYSPIWEILLMFISYNWYVRIIKKKVFFSVENDITEI